MNNYTNHRKYRWQRWAKIFSILILLGMVGVLKVNALEENEILVEISGEINNPGSYTMERGSTVYDLINEAGGVTENANTETIFWDRVLSNGDHIVIYPKDEVIAASSENNDFYDEVYNKRYNNFYYNYRYTYEKEWTDTYEQTTSKDILVDEVVEDPVGTCDIQTHIDGDYRLDVNTATAEQLYSQLYFTSYEYGFTMEHAEAMVTYRESKQGEPIYSLCEFVNLPGFTYEMVESFQPYLKVVL